MSRASGTLAILFSIAATAVMAQSQDRPSKKSLGPQRGTGLGLDYARYPKRVLLGNLMVLKEIKLSDDQKARLRIVNTRRSREVARLAEEIRKRSKDQLGAQPDPQAVAEFDEGVRPTVEAMTGEYEAALMKVLERDQRARIGQIQIQAEGPVAFTRPEFHKQLNLAPYRSKRS